MKPLDWQSLPNLQDKETYFTNFLVTLCLLIEEVEVAGLFWVASNQQLQVLAKFPDLASDVTGLMVACEQTLEDACGRVLPLTDSDTSSANHVVAFPIEVDGKAKLIIALTVYVDQEAELHQVMGQIEWGVAQIDRYFFQQQLSQLQTQSQSSIAANELLGQVLSQATFNEAIVSLVENLASHTHCERVSLGRFDGRKNKILAISNSLDFSQKLALVNQLQSAQLEAKMQLSRVTFPILAGAIQDPIISLAHQTLSESHGHNAVLTILIFDYQTDTPLFALTFERNGQKVFSEDELTQLTHLVRLVGAVILEKWQAQRSLWQSLKQALATQLKKLFGPRHTVRKVVLLMAVSLILLFSFLQAEYWLAADAKIEAQQQHWLTMPYDGYLETAPIKAGDQVVKGQLLAELDHRSQTLELLKARGKRQQLLAEFAGLQAQQDRAGMAVLQPKIQQVETDIRLAELYIQRAKIIAPVDGLVIQGDLTQRLGDALTTGESLFVIAQSSGYRVWIQTPESRVLDLHAGQTGRLVLQSLPHQHFDFEIQRVSPMQQVVEGSNFFLAEAILADHSDLSLIKPGMQGVAKIYIDERNQFGIWARDSYEWLQLTLWRWFGD